MKREKIKERNDFLIEEIKQHRGRENSISEKALAQVLADNGYGRGVCVHTLLRKLMFERDLPICFVNSAGYFWITSDEEIESAVADLQGRIEKLQAYIEHLNSFKEGV